MTDTPLIRVFVVDDHELIRRGLAGVIDQEDDLESVGGADTARAALARIPAARPDVAVLDVRLPDGDGIQVCREIRSRHPEVACLFLTSLAEEDALFEAVLAGAAGYLVKHARGHDIVDAIRRVSRGESLLDPTLTPKVLERLRQPLADRSPQLTDQEEKILGLIGEGLSNRDIAERMYLSEKTVRNYVSKVLGKLNVNNRTQAALYAAGLPSRVDGPPSVRPA